MNPTFVVTVVKGAPYVSVTSGGSMITTLAAGATTQVESANERPRHLWLVR
jgi:hypothetical protein